MTSDQHEIERLAREHAAWMYASARRRLGDDHLAEDVVQAVFLLLMRKRWQLAGEVKMTGWLYKAVCYCSANAIKVRRRRQDHERKAAMERPEVRGTPREETPPELDAAMDRLPSSDRAVLILRHCRGFSVDEVAKELGIAPEAAKKRIARAMERLRGLLLREGIPVEGAGMAVLLERAVLPVSEDLIARLASSAAAPAGASTLAAATAKTLAIAASAKIASGLTALALAVTATAVVVHAPPEPPPPPAAAAPVPLPVTVIEKPARLANPPASGPQIKTLLRTAADDTPTYGTLSTTWQVQTAETADRDLGTRLNLPQDEHTVGELVQMLGNATAGQVRLGEGLNADDPVLARRTRLASTKLMPAIAEICRAGALIPLRVTRDGSDIELRKGGDDRVFVTANDVMLLFLTRVERQTRIRGADLAVRESFSIYADGLLDPSLQFGLCYPPVLGPGAPQWPKSGFAWQLTFPTEQRNLFLGGLDAPKPILSVVEGRVPMRVAIETRQIDMLIRDGDTLGILAGGQGITVGQLRIENREVRLTWSAARQNGTTPDDFEAWLAHWRRWVELAEVVGPQGERARLTSSHGGSRQGEHWKQEVHTLDGEQWIQLLDVQEGVNVRWPIPTLTQKSFLEYRFQEVPVP